MTIPSQRSPSKTANESPKARVWSRSPTVLVRYSSAASRITRGALKPNAWKERLQSIVSSDAILDALAGVLKDSRHTAGIGALKYATEHGYCKATGTIHHTAADSAPLASQVWMFGDRKATF